MSVPIRSSRMPEPPRARGPDQGLKPPVKPQSSGPPAPQFPAERREAAPHPELSAATPVAGHTLVFDLETQKLASEVGGWDHKREMRMSVGVIYDLEEGAFREYMEHEAGALYDDLRRARLIVGFNVLDFDYEVLAAYVPRAQLDWLPTLDLLQRVSATLNRRVRLDDLARATLSKGKLGDGLEAVRWFRERNYVKLIEYCRRDVLVTKELYEFGAAHGYVLFPSLQGTMKLPVTW